MKIFNSIIFILLSLSVFGQSVNKTGFTLATPTQPTIMGCDTLTNTPIQMELGRLMCCFEVIDGQTFKRPDCENVVLGSCNQEVEFNDFELKYVCVIDDSAIIGINGERWDNSDGDDTNGVGAADFLPNSEVFINGVHINGTPSSTATITNNWSLNDLDFGPITSPDIHSQERYTAYLNITEPMLLRDNNGNTGEYLNVFIQDCNKDMVEVSSTFTARGNAGAGEFWDACEGIRKIEIQINDFSWYGGFNLQYSTDDGVTWAAFPMAETYTSSPKVTEICLKVDTDGNQFNLDGSEFTGKTIGCDLPCYPMSREVLPDTEVSITNGCFDVDGDPANYINVTQEVIFIDGEQSSVSFYQNYGADTQSELELGEYVFVDCATGEPIDEPVVPVNCEQAYPATAFAPIGDNGVNVWKWDNLNETYTAQDQASDIFDGAIDFTGTPAINSDEGVGVYEKQNDLFIRDINGQNAYKYQTYFYTTEPVLIREFRSTAESIDYYLGECQASSIFVSSGEYLNNTIPSDFQVSLSPGIHEIAGTVYDFSVWGFVSYQQSFDNGATWSNIPASQLYCKEPTLSECQVQVCTKESGAKILTDIETCLPLGSEYTLKKPSLCSGELAVASEPDCSTLMTFYKINYPEAGTVEQQWTTSAVAMSGATGTSYNSAFTTTDSEGYPSIAAAADLTISAATATTTNVSGLHQAQSDFYIFPTEPFNLSEFNATSETSGVWISEQCGSESMVEVLDATYTNNSENTIGYYQPGCYRVRLYCADFSANGVTRLRANDGNITAYPTKPTVEVVKEWVCSDQDISEFMAENGYLCEDPRCTASSSCNIKIVD